MTENIHQRPIPITVGWGVYLPKSETKANCRSVEDGHPERPSGAERTLPFECERQARGEEKSNRDNPTFKNRCNLMKRKEKAFSNRYKNTTSASPHFCQSPASLRSDVFCGACRACP